MTPTDILMQIMRRYPKLGKVVIVPEGIQYGRKKHIVTHADAERIMEEIHG